MSSPGLRSQLAVLNSGFESAGMVMGAGAYLVYQPVSCYAVGPRPVGVGVYEGYEEALRLAWWDVVARLEDEARRAQAHGVVGVYLIEKRPAPGRSMMELQLVGTGVRVPGQPPLARPFLSMLSLAETLRLLLGGWIASGIVVGVSAVHVHGWNASPLLQGAALTNTQMEAPTWGFQEARRRAEEGARQMLGQIGAEGLVSSQVEVRKVTRGDGGGGEGLLIEGRILGTGVVRFREPVAGIAGVRNMAKGVPV